MAVYAGLAKEINMKIFWSVVLMLSATALAQAPVSPYQIAYIAFQGLLKGQGIPGYGPLCQRLAEKKITGLEISNAATIAGFMPQDQATAEFNAQVEVQLGILCKDGTR
jgi:hypothetical protein